MSITLSDLKHRLKLFDEWLEKEYVKVDNDCRRGYPRDCGYQVAITNAGERIEELFEDLNLEEKE